MEKKTASAIMLALLLTSMLTLAFNIQPAKAASETIIDTHGDSRFTKYPSGPYWWSVADHDAFHTRAYNNNFWYTYCGDAAHGGDLYFGMWTPSVIGEYEVFVWIPNPDPFGTYTPTHSANYQIWHSSGLTERVVNQALRLGSWYSLGSFTFDASSSIILNDRTGEPYISTMIAFDAIKFTQVVPPRTLTVSSAHDSPNPSNGGHSYSNGQSVTCSVSSPVTEGGTVWTCTGWSGTGSVPASGTGKTVTFTITQDSTITWNWQGSVPPRTLTVSSAHDSPNPSNGQHTYNDGSSVTCSVSSPVVEGGVSYSCTGWSGTGSVPSSGSGTSVTFTITQASSITWNWIVTPPVPRTLTVYSSPSGVSFTANGVSHSTPWSGTYSQGTSVSLVMPSVYSEGEPRYYWHEWSDGEPSSSRTIILDANTTVTGTFIGPYYELIVASSPISGIPFTIDGASNTTLYSEWLYQGYYTIEMPATYNEYLWQHWQEGGDTNRIKTVSLATSTILTAIYSIPDFSISALPTSLTILQGRSSSSTIMIASINGFSRAVELEVSGHDGVELTLSQGEVTPAPDGSATSTLTISVSTWASSETYSLTVNGRSGALIHSASISLQIGLVFHPPFAVGDKDEGETAVGWAKTICHSSVDETTGAGVIQASADVKSYAGVADSWASITFIDTWSSTFSGEYRIVGAFRIRGEISVTILYAYGDFKPICHVTLDAWLTVRDITESRDVFTTKKRISDALLEEMDHVIEHYPDSTFFIEHLLDLDEGHMYSWIFEIEVHARMSANYGVAAGIAFGNIREAKLTDVHLESPELWDPPEEGPVEAMDNILLVAIGSPVKPLITDSNGRHIGFDTTSNQFVNEIPDAWYLGSESGLQLIYVLEPLFENCSALLVGTNEGTYELTVTLISQGEVMSFAALEIPIQSNAVHLHTVDWAALSLGEEGVTVEVDSDGNGVPEYTFTSDSELTQNEFLIQTGQSALYTFSIVWGAETFIVSVESNSTVSNFAFNQPGKEISFNVTGLDGTICFCNVTIPKALLYGEPWIVLIDGASVLPTITENATHNCLYFTYTHSTHTIQIIGTWVIGPPPPTYSLTITTTVGGTTNPVPGTYSYAANSPVQVTAIPAANYLFDYWELDGVNVGSANPYAVLMDKNHTLKAVFSPTPPQLSVSISPLSDSILVGQSVTFTSTVSGGYTPYSYQWYLNGAPVSGATSNTWAFTPTTGGIYYVHLKVTDAKGNTAQSQTARITASPVPVGGYSFPVGRSTKADPLTPYLTLVVISAIIFTAVKRKVSRKTKSSSKSFS